MFLDEPMSGLDSFMAKSILIILKKMSESGRSIICTIHQPSSEMFEMFDKSVKWLVTKLRNNFYILNCALHFIKVFFSEFL